MVTAARNDLPLRPQGAPEPVQRIAVASLTLFALGGAFGLASMLFWISTRKTNLAQMAKRITIYASSGSALVLATSAGLAIYHRVTRPAATPANLPPSRPPLSPEEAPTGVAIRRAFAETATEEEAVSLENEMQPHQMMNNYPLACEGYRLLSQHGKVRIAREAVEGYQGGRVDRPPYLTDAMIQIHVTRCAITAEGTLRRPANTVIGLVQQEKISPQIAQALLSAIDQTLVTRTMRRETMVTILEKTVLGKKVFQKLTAIALALKGQELPLIEEVFARLAPELAHQYRVGILRWLDFIVAQDLSQEIQRLVRNFASQARTPEQVAAMRTALERTELSKTAEAAFKQIEERHG